MMPWLGRAVRFDDHAAIWRATKPSVSPVGAAWFVSRFLAASSIVVRRWGPWWLTRWRVLGYDVGAWLLASAWLAAPAALLVRGTWSLLH